MTRLLAITCLLGLLGCGPKSTALDVLDLTPCDGWTGPTPATEGQIIRAALAEKTGRLCANTKLDAVAATIK